MRSAITSSVALFSRSRRTMWSVSSVIVMGAGMENSARWLHRVGREAYKEAVRKGYHLWRVVCGIARRGSKVWISALI